MNQTTDVNVVPSYGQRGELHFSQYDVGRVATINLYGVNEAYTIPVSSTVKIQATKPSGLGFDVACTYSGSVVTVTSTATMTEEAGRFPCEIKITKDSDIIGTANIMFCVEPSPHPDGVVDGDAEQVVNQVTALVLEAEGYALGTQNGVPVTTGSVYYQNNAKWFSENAVLSDEVKQNLLECFRNVAWIGNNGQTYYDALANALNRGAELVSISAVYSGGDVDASATLDSLKTDLVVTATYDDSSTETVLAYTLSGTLEVGTSTITVTYLEKTTTFSVTVTENRGIPEDYTWLYDAREGELLSAQNYVTTSSGGRGGSETLSNDLLVLATNPSEASISNFLRFSLTDTTTTNGKLSCRAKFVNGSESLAATGASGFRLQLSNGTSGAQAFFMNNNGNITVIYFEAGERKTVDTIFSFNDFHIYEVELINGSQKFSIDGTQIFSSTTLSTNYCTANAILNQASTAVYNPNGVTTNIDWLACYEVA